MKLNAAQRQVQTSGLSDTSTFRIRENAKMFNVLTSNIYTDKPRAIVRELSCNALDAHKMSGQTRPFDVMMPSAMSPMLVIRDYGPGLSHEDIMNLYTTFFDSTKDQSNEAVGAFGLGSKSPFAYTDAFTVTSYFGGFKRVYAAVKNDEGLPTISVITQVELDKKETGLEVTVPISPLDFYRFNDAAQKTFSFFPEGSYRLVGYEVTPNEYLIQSDSWALMRNRYEASRAVMGPVAYAIDFGAAGLPSEMREGLEFRFKLGEVDISPSREQLSMDKHTIQAIKERFQLFIEQVKQEVEDGIANAKTLWEANTLYNSAKQVANGPAQHAFPDNCVWNGHKINGWVKVELTTLPDDVSIKYCGRSSLHYKSQHLASPGGSTLTIAPNTSSLVVRDIWDAPTRVWARLSSNQGHAALQANRIFYIDGPNQASIDKILKELGDPVYTPLSQLPAPASIPTLRNSGGTQRGIPSFYYYKKRDPYYYDRRKSDWVLIGETDAASHTSGLFIPMKGYSIDYDEMEHAEIYRDSPWIGKQTIYGFPAKARKDFDMTEFTDVETFVMDKWNDIVADDAVWINYAEAYAFKQLVTPNKKAQNIRTLLEIGKVDGADAYNEFIVELKRLEGVYLSLAGSELNGFEKACEYPQVFKTDRVLADTVNALNDLWVAARDEVQTFWDVVDKSSDIYGTSDILKHRELCRKLIKMEVNQ